jgi:hypothetical protein
MNISREANNLRKIISLGSDEDYISCVIISENTNPVLYSTNISHASNELKKRRNTKKICIFKKTYLSIQSKPNSADASFTVVIIDGIYSGIKVTINGEDHGFNHIKKNNEELYEFFIRRIIEINDEIFSSAIEIGGNLYFSDKSQYTKT